MGTPTILTIEELLVSSEMTVTLPQLSKTLGGERTLRVRKISSAEYNSCLPLDPPESVDWPEDPAERAKVAAAWFDTLAPDQQEARRTVARDVLYRVVVAAALEPRLSLEQARRLGDDAVAAATKVLKFSGLLEPRRKPESTEKREEMTSGDVA